MNKAQQKLLTMLTYKRKEGSVGQQLFNNRFLKPMLGKPDVNDNYICQVTKDGKVIRLNVASDVPKDTIAFMAHHDTVHRTDGRQKVFLDPVSNICYVDESNGKECLGADCTTGVWLILEMIKAKVPGVYVVHAGEECGGIGATALVKSNPIWLANIFAAISFDRFGVGSVITHQMGERTCSESFANDLGDILGLGMEPDSGGVYTDSYEYATNVSECTNISVGYYSQHSNKEHQNLGFAMHLKDALIKADWSKLRGYRDPSVIEYDDWGTIGKGWTSKYKQQGSSYMSRFDDNYYEDIYSKASTMDDNLEVLSAKYKTMEKVIEEFPYEIAEILSEYGYNKDGLLKDILNYHKSSIPF